MKVIFDPVVESILELIIAQMAQTDEIELMMVVGGFVASLYLMKRINDTFIHQVEEVISPPDSGIAVCQGAVVLGINKESIMSRIAGKTYWIDLSPQFDAQLDPPE
jgi:activator of 2-hydroxyglutaryl-CoA dehydratase